MQNITLSSKIYATICGCLISLFSLEVFLRVSEYYIYKNNSNTEFKLYKKIYSDERSESYVFHHKKNINVKIREGDSSFSFITDANGFRGEDKKYKYLESVIFLGDSIVEGAGVENNEMMNSIYEQKTGTLTINFGVGSYNTAHAYRLLKSKYREEFNTKLIILGYCLNDAPMNTFLRYFDSNNGNWKFFKFLSNNEIAEEGIDSAQDFKKNNTPLIKIKRWLYKNLATYQLFSNLKKTIQNRKSHIYPSSDLTKSDLAYTKAHFLDLKNFAKSINSRFVVVLIPSESQIKNTDINYREFQQTAIINILEDLSIDYLDLFYPFKELHLKNPKLRYFWDDIHPNRAGHNFIGETISNSEKTRIK
jgi:lysophospholipase L1-like esterase